MNILLMHFRVGETDGVSLEMDKWKSVLESMGHNVFYLAGSAGTCTADLISELHYLDPINEKILHNAYIERVDFETDADLLTTIEQHADVISEKVVNIINKRDIDVVVPNNIWSLGYHLSAAIGLLNAIETTQTRVLCHHHDFHWERVKYSEPTSGGISNLLESIFPPKHPLVQHCVINRIAQEELRNRRGIEARVVPNVFDFKNSDWKIDEYNQDLRSRFGLCSHDIIFLQATRIVSRKGIEIAIDLIDKIEQYRHAMLGKTLYNGEVFSGDSRLVLMFAGLPEEDHYLHLLQERAKIKGVEIVVVSEWVDHSRSIREGEKIYSLWDVYCHADIITYPSLLEGWGNQFLEGLVAKLPIAVYRYPVYDLDIALHGFGIIDLGNNHAIDKQGLATIDSETLESAAKQAFSYLFDNEYRTEKMNSNYQIGEECYSYDALKAILKRLF